MDHEVLPVIKEIEDAISDLDSNYYIAIAKSFPEEEATKLINQYSRLDGQLYSLLHKLKRKNGISLNDHLENI
jgi:hypothetical protein